MNFGLSFSYVFKDEDWFKKIGITALVGLIPVVGQLIVAGWGIKITKNVIEGKEEYALPDLDFGADLGRGFMAALISLIYSIPVVLLISVSGALFGFGGSVEEATMIFLLIAGGCLGLIALLLGILIAFLSATALANYAAKGEFGAAFKFKELIAMLKKSFVSWLLVVVGYLLAMTFIAPLGAIACGIGALLTAVYAVAIYSHLLGQAYNESASPVVEEMETV